MKSKQHTNNSGLLSKSKGNASCSNRTVDACAIYAAELSKNGPIKVPSELGVQSRKMLDKLIPLIQLCKQQKHSGFASM